MNLLSSMLPMLSAIFLLSACSVRPIPPGTYSFSSDDLRESLTLSRDGSFTQDITIDGSPYHSAGTWTHRESNRVEFRTDFLVRFDTQAGATINPPQKYSYYVGYWHTNRRQIIFDDDGHYYLTAGSPATPAPK